MKKVVMLALVFAHFFFINNVQATVKSGYILPISTNIGDAFQSIAAKRFLPKRSIAIDRELIHQFNRPYPVKTIVSGWFMHTKEGTFWERFDAGIPEKSWPPSSCIDPLLISIHITGSLFDQAFSPQGIEYFKDHGPVGARDFFTLEELQKRNIPSYFSGCLTLTLENTSKTRGDIIYLVDIDEDCVEYIKSKTKSPVVVLTHGKNISSTQKTLEYAEELLVKYQKAKCVITSRLHAAMPCLAFETPVLFIGSESGPRFGGLIEHTRNCLHADLLQGRIDYDFDNPPKNPNTHLDIRENLIKIVSEWVVQNNIK